MKSGLYVGTVRHRRRRPRDHAFRYRTYHTLVALDELATLDRHVGGFGVNRAAVVSFYDRDHFDRTARPVRDKLAEVLARHDVAMPTGSIAVLTNLRVLGHVFNPVSWWFCHDDAGVLVLVVAEVHNTFGDQYAYVLDDLQRMPDMTVRARARKVLHVSPFLPIEHHDYAFVFRVDNERLLAHIDVHDAEGIVLDATQVGHRRPLNTRTLWRLLVTHPLLPLRTVVLIHLHAVVLWWRRTPFYRRPAADGTHRLDPASTVRNARRGR